MYRLSSSGPHREISAERVSTEVEVFHSLLYGDLLGQLRLWADGLDVSEGRLDKALKRGPALKTTLFAVLICDNHFVD
jgi:hypothetical protein